MATVKEVVLKHHKKEDGTWNVKIRVTHGNKSVYINTSHFVSAKQIKKDFTLKDTFIIDMIAPVLAEYRKKISSLGDRIYRMTAKDIAFELGRKDEVEGVNFGAFCREHIDYLKGNGKISSANNMQTVYNSIVDFYGSENIMASEITALRLKEYEEYLKRKRTMYRANQFGKIVKIVRPGVTSGLHNYMRDLRLLFNAARDRYNDEDSGIIRIPHYPFRKYKVPNTQAPEKRNLPIDKIRAIRDLEVVKNGRAELARDLFMLSFYLCGMNSVDLYHLKNTNKGRVEYFRAKTSGRRKDKAFISIKAIEPAVPLLEKYIGKLSDRYSNHDNLNSAINKGLKDIGKAIGVDDLTFYYARHTFGDTARNKCRFSKDDVGLALNHVDHGKKTTDTYIAPDWAIVDEVQEKVIGLLDNK